MTMVYLFSTVLQPPMLAKLRRFVAASVAHVVARHMASIDP